MGVNNIEREHLIGAIDCLSRAVARLDEVTDENDLSPLVRRQLAVIRELIRDGRGPLYDATGLR